MSKTRFEYECVLTGLTSPGAEPEGEDEDMPVGWTKIRFTRRQYNPKWVMLQQLKESMQNGLLVQHTQGHPELAEPHQKLAIQLQVEANFYAMLQDTPMYILDVDDSVFLSDGGEVVGSINEMRETLGLEKLEEEEEEGADDNTGEQP